MKPKITSVRFSSGKARKAAKLGDLRTTKAHGLQIRVVETHNGMWVRNSSSYRYEWRTPEQLYGTCWEYLLKRIISTETASIPQDATHPD